MPIIPPLALVAVCAALMVATDRLMPLDFDFPARMMLAALITIAAILFALAAVLAFRRARTTVDPRDPAMASSLVTTGPFRFSRNPMYVAFTAWLLAL